MNTVPVRHGTVGLGHQGCVEGGFVGEEASERGGDHAFGGAGRAVLAFEDDGDAFSGMAAQKTPSAPVLAKMRPGAVFISRVQARLVPAT